MAGTDGDEDAENWRQIAAPLGEEWSGRARYAAAMHFYHRGLISAEILEVYRVCARLDAEDPLGMLRDQGIGQDWIARLLSARHGSTLKQVD